jgi:predicted Zn-dependent protease
MMFQRKRLIAVAVLIATGISADAARQATTDKEEFAQLYRSAQSAMASGKYDEARSDFERLEKIDITVAEVHASLAILCYKAGDFNHAIVEIRMARMLKPQLPGLDALLALSLAESGKARESLPGLEKAFRSEKNPEVKRQAGLELARVYTDLSMDKQAVETALELRDLYKGDPEILYNVGKILGNSAYLTMQDLFHSTGAGNSLWVLLAEAEAYESQGLYADAVEAYRRVLVIEPNRPDVHYRMGRTYLSRWKISHSAEDLASADAELAKEIDANPGNANAACELAGMRSRHGDQVAAQKLYEAAIRDYPDFEEAEVGLAGILLDEQNPSLAVVHLHRATTLRGDDEVAWYRLAQAERQLGNAEAQKQALATFQRLRERSRAALNKVASSQFKDSVSPQERSPEAQSQ